MFLLETTTSTLVAITRIMLRCLSFLKSRRMSLAGLCAGWEKLERVKGFES